MSKDHEGMLSHTVSRRTFLTATASVATAMAWGLSGCGRPATTSGPKKLTWLFWGSTDHLEIRKQTMQSYEQAYQNTTLNPIHVPGGPNDLFQKLQVMVGGGEQVDAFMASPVWIGGLASKGLYASLDNLKGGLFKEEDYVKTALDGFRFKGKLYALPELVNFAVVFYNKSLFAKAGVPVPKPGWTWDQFADTAKQMTVQEGGKTVQWGAYPVDTDLNNLLPWIWMNGGQVFDDERYPNKVQFNDKAIEALQWRADWALKEKIAPVPTDIAGQANLFLSGKVAMFVSTVATVPNLVKSITDFEWDAVALPVGPTGPANFAGSACQGVAEASKDPKAAASLVAYMAGPEGLRPMMMGQHGLPSVVKMLKDDYLKLQGPPFNRKMLVEEIDHLRPLPITDKMLELYYPVFGQQLTDLFAGRKTAREVAQAIEEQGNKVFAS